MGLGLSSAVMCVGCYLVGAIPFGFIVGRAKGVDIREAGSGNIGATNVGRLFGRPWGIFVFALDVCKGLIPTVAAGMIIKGQMEDWQTSLAVANLLWLGSGICCVIGHNFPVFLRFKGGKGVATSLGVVLGVYPYLAIPGLAAFVVWVIVTLVSRYVSLGSVVAAVALPMLFVCYMRFRGESILGDNWPLLTFLLLVGSLVIYRHRGNITRLRAELKVRFAPKNEA